MGRFQFRLQRVLDYRSSLVEAQEAELGRCAFQLQNAEREKAKIEQRQRDLLQAMAQTGTGVLRPDRAKTAWDYWSRLRRQHELAEEDVRAKMAAVEEARAKLAQLRKEEKVMEKLRERQQTRADAAERLQEVKSLDDLTTTRFRRQ